MNPARAQKMNKFIVDDYFRKLKEVMTALELFDKPGNIYNMDEKGCRLTIHKQQVVLAKKGAKRVHLTAPEHGENVTIVGCGNALGQAVPPFILFKGQRLKAEWSDHLPPGSKAIVSKKGSMTTEAFVSWLQHFSSFKNPGSTLLVFDGAKCHLDVTIVDAADNLGITLFCLPSNTTHELQPMDKAVFKSFESFWDQEVYQFLTTNPGKAITKLRFGEIFSKVWLKAMTPSNIISGFKATGIYPYCPDSIPESAYAPSLISRVEESNKENESNVRKPDNTLSTNSATDRANIRNPEVLQFKDGPTTSGYTPKQKLAKEKHKKRESASTDSDTSDYSVHDDSSDNFSSSSKEELSLSILQSKVINSKNNKQKWNIQKNQKKTPEAKAVDNSFQDIGLLITPDVKVTAAKRKPAINSKAQQVTKDLFSPKSDVKLKNKNIDSKSCLNSKKSTESWFCFLCNEDREDDMRLCVVCVRYVHEVCVGLTKEDKDIFVCPICAVK